MASITQRFLVPVSTVSARNAWHNDRLLCPKNSGRYFQKNWEGVCGTLLETLTPFQTKICDFPYPISDLIKNLIPYLRPDALEPGSWPERVTSCYGTYTVLCVNIKREMVLLLNDEEVANCSKKHTQFKTRVHKPYPISDQNGRNWYPVSDQNSEKRKHTLWCGTYLYGRNKGLPLPRGGGGNALQIMSLAAYASETNKIVEVWNSANRLLSDFFCLLSSIIFATVTTWRNDFSSLLDWDK